MIIYVEFCDVKFFCTACSVCSCLYLTYPSALACQLPAGACWLSLSVCLSVTWGEGGSWNHRSQSTFLPPQQYVKFISWLHTVWHSRLQESSPEEPNMHQHSWHPGLCLGPHQGAYSAPQALYLVIGGLLPLTQEPTSAQLLGLWARLAPAISFQRHSSVTCVVESIKCQVPVCSLRQAVPTSTCSTYHCVEPTWWSVLITWLTMARLTPL